MTNKGCADKKPAVDMTAMEHEYWNRGLRVAGLDEAGRGPLAGPVAAACVIMPPEPMIDGVNDSKKLTEKRRYALAERIQQVATAYCVAMVDAEFINENGIQAAVLRAFAKAYDGMGVAADTALADYVVGLNLPVPFSVHKSGDALSYSIASASILAKTARDAYMLEMDREYPQFGFARHKGYGTALHVEAIRRFGSCPLHRTQFVASALCKQTRLSEKDLEFLANAGRMK